MHQSQASHCVPFFCRSLCRPVFGVVVSMLFELLRRHWMMSIRSLFSLLQRNVPDL